MDSWRIFLSISFAAFGIWGVDKRQSDAPHMHVQFFIIAIYGDIYFLFLFALLSILFEVYNIIWGSFILSWSLAILFLCWYYIGLISFNIYHVISLLVISHWYYYGTNRYIKYTSLISFLITKFHCHFILWFIWTSLFWNRPFNACRYIK